MNGIKYVLDTNILIGLFDYHPGVIAFLEKKAVIPLKESTLSVISRMELLSFPSLSTEEENIIRKKLDAFAFVLPLDEDIEAKAILLRKELRIKLPDAIIAATAMVNNLELLTLDEDLLKKITEVKV
jgi:hypothetical protein